MAEFVVKVVCWLWRGLRLMFSTGRLIPLKPERLLRTLMFTDAPRWVKKLNLRKGGSFPTFLVLDGCCTTSLPWTPAGFLQRGSQLRGDPVAHKPELCCKAQRQRRRRHQGQLIQAWPMAAGGRLSRIV
jgi:hypothetical protein